MVSLHYNCPNNLLLQLINSCRGQHESVLAGNHEGHSTASIITTCRYIHVEIKELHFHAVYRM